MTVEPLREAHRATPFRAFRIHLSDGTSAEVPERVMVIVGRSTAVLPIRFGRDAQGRLLAENWRTVARVPIVQFSDLEEKTNGRRKRR